MKESSKFKDSNYLIVFGWMVNQLELKGNDLLIFALIFGFTQDGMSKFNGSLQYMADATNSTIRGVQKNLKSLLDRNLIVKEDYSERDITLCKYYVSPEILDKFSAYEQSSRVWNKVLEGMEQSSMGYRTEFHGGIEQSSNNNINNTIEDIKEDKKKNIKKENKVIPPTLEMVTRYCEERHNRVNPQAFIDFYQSKDWMVGKNKMKDWQACVRTWEQNQKPKSNIKWCDTKTEADIELQKELDKII